MPYLKLLKGRSDPRGAPDDVEDEGPLLGPFDFVRTAHGREIQLGEQAGYILTVIDGRVYYAGTYYGEWTVFAGSINPLVQGPLTPFAPEQAIPPAEAERCECEPPGYFCSGVPGILAHLENGRVVPGFEVERCDACRRYESDEAAEAKLRELGLFSAADPRSLAPEARQPTYSVHCYATVRVKLTGIPAADPRDAARRAGELFEWDRHAAQAEFADEVTAFLVDVDGDEDFSHSKTFGPDLNELDSARSRGVAWLLVINRETKERIEVFSSWEAAFQQLYEYVQEQWEGTFGEEPIDPDAKRAVERFFDVGPVGYTLEERTLL